MPAETRSKAMKSGSWSSYQAAAELPDRDDEEDVPAAEVITGPCLGCGKAIRYPVDAEGDDCCCSDLCVAEVCRRLDAEIQALRVADAAELEASLVVGGCALCGRPTRALPVDFQTGTAFCSPTCERERAAQIWGSYENPLDDDVPY